MSDWLELVLPFGAVSPEQSTKNGNESEFVPQNEFARGEFSAPPSLHRIRKVRLEQETTLRSIATRTGASCRQLAEEEEDECDILLSRLYWWKRVLDVPVADLLIEPDAGLSPLILERVRMLRIMKTVATIQREAKGDTLRRLAETLEKQMLEIAPDMNGVLPWKSIGQRRTLDELGRIGERTFSIHEFMDA